MAEELLIYNIIRKIISGNKDRKTYLELDYQLGNMIREWLKTRGNFDEELLLDIKQTVMMSLLESFKNNIFWEEKLPETDDNNKLIISYIYKIIKSSYRINIKDITTEEAKNLRVAVLNVLKTLVDENKIVVQKKNKIDFYTLNNNSDKKNYDWYDEIRTFFVLRKKSKNKIGKISSDAVYDALLQIFNKLENFYLSVSDIMEILLTNSDVNEYSFSYLTNSTQEEYENEKNTISEEHLSMNDDSIEKLTNIEDIINSLNMRLKYYINKKSKEDIYKIVFYLYYQAGFTLREVSDYLQQKFNIYLSLQTIKNYLGDFINILNLQKDFSSEESEIIQILEVFMKSIEKEFNLSE